MTVTTTEPGVPQHRRIRSRKDERPRALAGVALGLAAVLLLATSVHASLGASQPSYLGSPALSVVELSQPSVWRCPGPLPVGSQGAQSGIEIANIGASPSNATVTISEVASTRHAVAASTGIIAEGTASVTERHLIVAAGSQRDIPLSSSGPRGSAAVTVETTTGGVAVSETLRSSQSVLASPCASGTSRAGYLAQASTLGASDALVSLYDPVATPAVDSVTVVSGATSIAPAAFQGIVVPPSGVVVLDLARWAPQKATFAVAATSSAGAVVLGAFETMSAFVPVTTDGSTGVVHKIRLSGSALLTGAAHPVASWTFGTGPTGSGVSTAFAIYVPGSQSTKVDVVPVEPAGADAAVSIEVGGGSTAVVPAPIPSGNVPAPGVVVESSGGGGIVVARVFTGIGAAPLRGSGVAGPSAGPSRIWVVPGLGTSVPASTTQAILVTNPGRVAMTVELTGLGTSTASPVTITVGPGDAVTEKLPVAGGGSTSGAGAGATSAVAAEAFVVRSTGPILVERLVTPFRGGVTSVQGIPVR